MPPFITKRMFHFGEVHERVAADRDDVGDFPFSVESRCRSRDHSSAYGPPSCTRLQRRGGVIPICGNTRTGSPEYCAGWQATSRRMPAIGLLIGGSSSKILAQS